MCFLVDMVGWLCFTSHRQRGHSEAVPPFTVPCEGHEAWFLHPTHWESNPGLTCIFTVFYYMLLCKIAQLTYLERLHGFASNFVRMFLNWTPTKIVIMGELIIPTMSHY